MPSIERDKILNKQNIEVAYDLNIHNVFTGHFTESEVRCNSWKQLSRWSGQFISYRIATSSNLLFINP